MNSLIDDTLVGLVLLVSAAYAVASLGPRSLRQRALLFCSRLLARVPEFFGLRRAAERVAIAATGKAPGACGGCDNCGTDKEATTQSPAGEINVPVSKIGLRRSR